MSTKRAKIPLDAMVARKGADAAGAPQPPEPPASAGPAAEEVPRTTGRPRKRERSVTVSLRLPPETYRAFAEMAALEKIAARADGRPVESMNDMMLAALRDYLAKRRARG